MPNAMGCYEKDYGMGLKAQQELYAAQDPRRQERQTGSHPVLWVKNA